MRIPFFPSPTLAVYLGKAFLIRTLAVLALLVVVLTSLDLLGESGKILAVPGNSSDDVMRYLGLRVPQIVSRFLPFSVLLGTLITLATLNQNSEVISMKAAGMSAHQILAPLILAGALVALISFGFNERVVTRATAALSKWQKVEYQAVPKDSLVKSNVWVRDGANLIHARLVTGKAPNLILNDVTVYDRTSGALDRVISARGAVAQAGGGWEVVDAERFDVATGASTPIGSVHVAKGVSPEQFTLINVDGDSLAVQPLRSTIAELKKAGRPTAALEGALWHKFSGPMSAILMPLLGAVAAFGLARSGKLFVRAVIGMALGFAYFVADNFAIAMGDLGAYPPWLSAWGPFFLFLLIGELVLIRTEE